MDVAMLDMFQGLRCLGARRRDTARQRAEY